MKKTLILLFTILYFSSSIIANPFNKNLSSKERAKLEKYRQMLDEVQARLAQLKK